MHKPTWSKYWEYSHPGKTKPITLSLSQKKLKYNASTKIASAMAWHRYEYGVSGTVGGETERVIIWGRADVVIGQLLPIITFIFILLHVKFR